MEKAWSSLRLLAEARAKRKTVLKVRCFKEAWPKGSKGALVRARRTTERFHFGARERPTGLANSKDLMSSERTESEPIEGEPETNFRVLESIAR